MGREYSSQTLHYTAGWNCVPGSKGGSFKSTCVAEIGGARKHGLLPAFNKEMEKLGKEKAALRSNLAETVP